MIRRWLIHGVVLGPVETLQICWHTGFLCTTLRWHDLASKPLPIADQIGVDTSAFQPGPAVGRGRHGGGSFLPC